MTVPFSSHPVPGSLTTIPCSRQTTISLCYPQPPPLGSALPTASDLSTLHSTLPPHEMEFPATLALGSNPSSNAYLVHIPGQVHQPLCRVCHMQMMIPNSSDCGEKYISGELPSQSLGPCTVHTINGGYPLSATSLQGLAHTTPPYEAFTNPAPTTKPAFLVYSTLQYSCACPSPNSIGTPRKGGAGPFIFTFLKHLS